MGGNPFTVIPLGNTIRPTLSTSNPMNFIFVNESNLDPSTLMQGDLLKRNKLLGETLREHSENPLNFEAIQYFVVLNQSCDLVLRNKKPKTQYITFAPVYDLAIAINERTNKLKDNNIDGQISICNSKDRTQTLQYVERLLNNSERDYFCLPLECHESFSDDHCISLNLTISISNKFYNQCLNSKIGQMEEIFAAKLGWMAGNKFSRVATPDIEDILKRTGNATSYKSTFIARAFSSQTIWLSTHQIRELKKIIKRSNVSKPLSNRKLLELTNQVPSNYSLAISRIVAILLNDKIVNYEQVDEIKEKLTNDKNLKSLVVNTID